MIWSLTDNDEYWAMISENLVDFTGISKIPEINCSSALFWCSLTKDNRRSPCVHIYVVHLRTNFGYFMQVWWAHNACTSFKNNRITAHISPWCSILHFSLKFLNFRNGPLEGWIHGNQTIKLRVVEFFQNILFRLFFHQNPNKTFSLNRGTNSIRSQQG